MHKWLHESTCDAQTAKGNPQKLITSGFNEHSANYAVFSTMYIKILSSKIKITTKRKNLITVSAYTKSTDFILEGHKKPNKSAETVPLMTLIRSKRLQSKIKSLNYP
jgi:hypothetical protein